MSELRINNITDRAGSSGPIIAGVSTVSSTSHMVMPSGPTEMRPNPPSKLPLSGKQEILSSGGRGRGIFFANYPAPSSDAIEKIEIATTGNATDFGDTSAPRNLGASFASSTRGILAGGQPGASPYYVSTIDFVIISSEGGANDFGDLTKGRLDSLISDRGACGGGNDRTRGLIAGGNTPGDGGARKTIDFVTMASTGDSSDFGELIQQRFDFNGSVGNGVRAIFAGGYSQTTPAATFFKSIETVNVQTRGSTTKFGELSATRGRTTSTSNSTRGLVGIGGGPAPNTRTDIIEFITLSTEGNVTDFGNLVSSVLSPNATSSSTRGVVAGGNDGSPAQIDIIQFVTISTTGNATDFGDLSAAKQGLSGCSDVNGGLAQ